MTLTTDFTYQLGNSGFILNSNATTYPFVDVHNVKGLDSAPSRTSVRDRDGNEGGYVDSEFEQTRTIVLTGVLYDDVMNTEVTTDQLKGEWALSRVPIALYMRHPKVGTRMAWVKPQGVRYDVDQLRRLGTCAIEFTALAGDPRIYSGTESVKTLTVSNVIQTGFAFNLGFNFGFGGVTPATLPPLIINAGNRPTPVKYRMYGPYINPHIVLNGEEMAFDMVVSDPTYYLEVDTDARTVRFHALFGSQNRRDTLRRPSWTHLQPGSNSVLFNVEGGSAGATHMDVIWRSAWR